jgi:8-oxo-dGTP diphosphatase
MQDATLVLLVRGDPPAEILLGLKKAGFGQGKYGGFGGKVEAGETIAQAAARELLEETSIDVPEADLHQVGHLTFLFPHKPAWSQMVHVFLVTTWNGEAVESEEMLPAWFPVKEIPYDQMWADGIHWLPPILAGEQVRARFWFQADNETVDRFEMQGEP